MKIRPEDMDVVILCGGQGKRLEGFTGGLPKPMVEVGGRPFLDIIIDHLAGFGPRRFIFCSGFKGDFIKDYYGMGKDGLEFLISEEALPMGTAGAVKNAQALIKSEHFLTLNGDSFCPLDIRDFLSFHLRKKALATIALTTVKESSDYGAVEVDKVRRVLGFREKVGGHAGFVNAGIYLFCREFIDEIPSGQRLELEHDVFPSVLQKGIYGYVTQEMLLDIGTPRRLKEARRYFRERGGK